ncbi:hypothetical protein EHI8A_098590 [Entamoeba histolytica HM-1:IMSS-B]|uniref:UDENN domain-containing protein n=6 Tax=Entamoeba histolytica TaxID=5759 RepID=C4LYS9_ENTH1|nr:hypothetical protein EHI_010320 [Entamoeba histolytica HM-1:IMSS]EMD43183.1 Hypothetical protein EHI5A_104370 [Entamoeba histolytica KU27]EMH73258.1 hypothetical protein EHI8A_098590 [Entamoeba histolytica HM-1:IMSS-B]EMS12855.1 hypothetical protein KM1_227500 [Entamoeba histolytica HM-3:IMSS]ENY59817.1 hypothetical protein EHI7A_099380 [Entamoeba histolytica HM-1:IMSS-A]GAT93994.1 hypothetical protein CL6EHI_010320 [Entamoeba histolytica]|eukprot:XP_654827.1 hypothetical protein EHI_010320 [Entamoeba histolytica HM-1:IMSS]
MEHHSPIQQALNVAPGKVVESFSIWGLPSKFRVTKPFNFFRKVQTFPSQLLFKYPQEATINEKIQEFIIPKGIELKIAENIETILNSPLGIHITFIPGDDPLFCICITRRELLQFPSDLVEETNMSSIYSSQPLETNRVYCIMTHCPDISVLSPIIKDLFALDFSLKDQWLKQFYLKTVPLIPTFKYQSSSERLLPILKSFNNLVATKPPIELIADHAIIRLFAVTKITGILSMISSLLLNVSVFLIGKNVSLVTDCVLALLPLIQPFQWEGVVLPYIPSHLYEFLESPIPSIYGTELPTEKVNVSAFVAPVEPLGIMDSIDRIFVNNEKMPLPIPYFEEVYLDLKRIANKYLSHVLILTTYEERINEIVKTNKSSEFAQEVLKSLKEHFFNKIIGRITIYCKQNGPIELKHFQETFPLSINDNTKQWYSEFIVSQHFSSWWLKNDMSNLHK